MKLLSKPTQSNNPSKILQNQINVAATVSETGSNVIKILVEI
jgi:hypothetical protein